jgi:hypothetical protein
LAFSGDQRWLDWAARGFARGAAAARVRVAAARRRERFMQTIVGG